MTVATKRADVAPARPGQPVRVRRTTRAAYVGGALLVLLVIALAYAPYVVSRGTQIRLVLLFSYVLLGTMWNLLAGYGGMVSVGQQAFIGIGGYGLVYLADHAGVNPMLAVPLAAAVCGVVAWLTSFLVFRLLGGYFAIGTWVVAEVLRLLTRQLDVLGAGSGTSLRAWSVYSPAHRIAYVYWLSLAGTAVAVLAVYALMRSRLGLGLTAIRDDATAAGSLGVRVTRSKRLVYVVAAVGCGLAGGMIASNTLRVQPESIYSVNYSAVMIFIVVIGGIGTIEGPIVGAILFYLLEQQLADLGSWYLALLGGVAILCTVFLPQGVWGLLTRGRVRLFPVGYELRAAPRTEARS
jgi:branched-chain amino acid transport system permease protein